MSKRVTLTLDDDIWAEYHKQPFRQRGKWLSDAARKGLTTPFPPLPPAEVVSGLEDWLPAYRRWQAHQNKTGQV